MVVADQQGTDVYIFDEKGQKGQFETLLPIEKVKVARQGVVAAVLTDEDVTWINLTIHRAARLPRCGPQ